MGDNAIAGPSRAVDDEGRQYQSDILLINIEGSEMKDEEHAGGWNQPTVNEDKEGSDNEHEDTESVSDLEDDKAVVTDELVLDEQGYIETGALPSGWTSIRHESGLNLYIGPGRVCTTSRPYFLGAGSVRRHDVPRSAIPCLSYIFTPPTDNHVNLKTAQEVSLPEEVDIDSELVAIKSYICEESCVATVEQEIGDSSASNVARVEKAEAAQDFAIVEVLSDSDDEDLPREVLVIEEIDDGEYVIEVEEIDDGEYVIEDHDYFGQVEVPMEQDILADGLTPLEKPVDTGAINAIKDDDEETDKFPLAAPVQHAVPKVTLLQDVTIREGVVISNSEDNECAKYKSVSTKELGEYCERLFLFKKIRVMRFNSWSERRQFSKRRKHVHQLHRPDTHEPKVIIKCPVQSKEGESNKKWLMNTAGKSHVCILHEYVQHSLKKQPKYTFSELENAATPYAATVTINDMKYGVGYGTSKKQAKSNAAKATLQILIPEIDKPAEENASVGEDVDISNMAFFDSVRILDPRVSDFCVKTTEPLPCDLLKACLQRNENIGEMNITYEGNGEGDEEMLKFTMTVGPHLATVSCKNKREAKQQAAQAILQKLHPHVHSWGALLRLYGSGGYMGFKEKLTQKSSEQKPALHVPQEHKAQSTKQCLNEAILQGLRGRFDSLRVKGLEIPYAKKEYQIEELPSPPVPPLENPEEILE